MKLKELSKSTPRKNSVQRKKGSPPQKSNPPYMSSSVQPTCAEPCLDFSLIQLKYKKASWGNSAAKSETRSSTPLFSSLARNPQLFVRKNYCNSSSPCSVCLKTPSALVSLKNTNLENTKPPPKYQSSKGPQHSTGFRPWCIRFRHSVYAVPHSRCLCSGVYCKKSSNIHPQLGCESGLILNQQALR